MTTICRCSHSFEWHYDPRTDPTMPCQSCGCQAFVRCLHEVTELQATILPGQTDVVCVTCGATSPQVAP